MRTESGSSEPLLVVDGLEVTLGGGDEALTLLRDVGFEVGRRESVAIVGESGSGKSVTALTLMGLLGADARCHGTLRFDGLDLFDLAPRARRELRGRRMAMIFQDPLSALDPMFTVGRHVREALRWGGSPRAGVERRAVELLGHVGLPNPEGAMRVFPHELSGGQRQRVLIAMAMSCAPDLIIADEPTTALDATVEAQILDLIRALQTESGTSLLLITHDMSVVAQMADRVVVMYGGGIVEQGPVAEVLGSPAHPYTQALIRAVPRVSMDRSLPLATIEGSVPGPRSRIGGCRFHPRCTVAIDRCAVEEPPRRTASPGQEAKCWLVGEGSSPIGVTAARGLAR